MIRARSIGMGCILAHRVDMEKGVAASKRAACIAAAKSASDRRWMHLLRSGMPIAREDPCCHAVRSRQCMSPDIGSVIDCSASATSFDCLQHAGRAFERTRRSLG